MIDFLKALCAFFIFLSALGVALKSILLICGVKEDKND